MNITTSSLISGHPARPLPPPSNRGVTVANFGVHWFEGTTFEPVSSVRGALAELLGADLTDTGRGRLGYAFSAIGADGVALCWSLGRSDVHLVIPGAACDAIGAVGLEAIRLSCKLEAVTRLDLAWDITGLEPSDLRRWWAAGDVVSRAHRDSWRWQESATGSTFYIGSRQSPRMVRCYDARGVTRIELECKAHRAGMYWAELLKHSSEDWSRVALGFLLDYVDFKDRSDTDEPSRAPRFPIWGQFVGDAERHTVTTPRREASLDRSRRWMSKQVAPLLAVLYDAAEGDCAGSGARYLREIYTSGLARRRMRHRLLLAQSGSARAQKP